MTHTRSWHQHWLLGWAFSVCLASVSSGQDDPESLDGKAELILDSARLKLGEPLKGRIVFSLRPKGVELGTELELNGPGVYPNFEFRNVPSEIYRSVNAYAIEKPIKAGKEYEAPFVFGLSEKICRGLPGDLRLPPFRAGRYRVRACVSSPNDRWNDMGRASTFGSLSGPWIEFDVVDDGGNVAREDDVLALIAQKTGQDRGLLAEYYAAQGYGLEALAKTIPHSQVIPLVEHDQEPFLISVEPGEKCSVVSGALRGPGHLCLSLPMNVLLTPNSEFVAPKEQGVYRVQCLSHSREISGWYVVPSSQGK